MFSKLINWFDKPSVVACDGKCGKAWGINTRQKMHLDSSDPDDYYFFSDGELGEAPARPQTSEGGDMKPVGATSGADMNKWCTRECCRSVIVRAGEPVVLTDFSHRLYNQPDKHRDTPNHELPAEVPAPFDRYLQAGRDAYEAFVEAMGEGGDRPGWYDLSEKEQQAWRSVVVQIWEGVHGYRR